MKRLYRCLKCGALCRQFVWEALGLERAEDKCPACGKWAKFEAQAARPEAGEKAA